MTPAARAEAIIDELAIRDVKDLDVEVIAMDAGMQVVYQHLEGCAATLLGVGNRAIATVCPSGSIGRDRFSVGHELGHWNMHRGRSFVCRSSDIGENEASNLDDERAADEFSAHLLMPTALMTDATRGLKRLRLKDVDTLGNDFKTSRVAMAFRLIRMNNFPFILACYSATGMRWQFRSKAVPARWWLKKELDQASFAYDLLQRGSVDSGKQSADAWFDNDDSADHELHEECAPYLNGQALVLLHVEGSGMLSAEFDKNLWSGMRRR